MRQVKDLQVEVSPAFLYDFEVAQALRSDAAVREVKLLEQRGCLGSGNSLHDC